MPTFEIHTFDSAILGRKRKVRVWHPGDAAPFPPRRVLIQQDGQLAFSSRDAELPYGSWRLDVWLEKLIRAGAIEPVIAVGIDNSPSRLKEYFPLTEEFRRFERFLLDEALPWIDREIVPLHSPESVALMGSSMGGLASFALAANHPGHFGAAACLSPWFEHRHNQYIHDDLHHMKSKPPIRVYMDSGIRDWRDLDDGHRGMLMARLELLRLGFVEGQNLTWRVDTWFPTEQDLRDSLVKPDKRAMAMRNQHTEFHWNRRLELPLRFLFGSITAVRPPS